MNTLKYTLSCLLIAMTASAQAATLYVKPDGDDGKACTSWTAACKTIGQAASKAQSDDEIHIAKGVYVLTAAINVSGKNLSFIGGFDVGATAPTGDKSSTVISGDTDNNDTNKTNGITPSYSDIVGNNLSQAFNVSNGDFSFEHLTITGIKGAYVDAHGPAIFYAGSSKAVSQLNLNDVGIVGNIGHSMGLVMAYTTTGVVNTTVKNSLFKNNSGDAGVLTMHDGAKGLVVTESTFEGNRAAVDLAGWDNGHSGIWMQSGSVSVENSVFSDNQSSNQGAALVLDSGVAASIKNSTFKKNIAGGIKWDADSASIVPDGIGTGRTQGGAIYTAGIVHLNIEDSHFEQNQGSLGGVIYVGGHRGDRSSQITVARSSFTSNQASSDGGAIYAEQGSWSLINTTVSNNNSAYNGGGIANNGALMKLRYVTMVGNQSSQYGGGLALYNDSSSVTELEASIVTGNNSGDICLDNATLMDKGYNLIGSNANASLLNTSGTAIPYQTVFNHKDNSNNYTTQVIEGAPSSVLELTAKNNGGKSGVYTNKLLKNSAARDAVPNTGALFYGVGKTAAYPFTALAQINSFIPREGYGAGTYYFDLGGNYAEDLTFTEGTDPSLIFTSYVDEDGYVLVASSGRTTNLTPYTQTDALSRRSDNILRSAVLAHPKFAITSVRISGASTRAGIGVFDGYTTHDTVIADIKSFKPLSSGDAFGWIVTKSTSGKNYFAGANSTSSADNLAASIYKTNGADAMIWNPKDTTEVLSSAGNPTSNDELDLWVKNTTGLCDGSVATDGRGLPRSDRVKVEESVHNCDIGAFEFNDYFRDDCDDEDGMRPENTIYNTKLSWCGNPFASNPRDLLENAGAFNWYWSLALLGLLAVRLRKSV